MEEIILEAELRSEVGRGKIKDMRQKGFIPAVVYGEGKDAKAIKVGQKGLLRLMHEHRFENAIINLKIKDDKNKKSMSCLIKEVQYDPVRSNVVHVDFNEISLTKAIKIKVPVSVKGESVGVKQDGGSLEHVLWEIEVECLPTDIPKSIEIDISGLKIGDAIHIKDITFPPKVKVLTDADSVIISVAAPMKEEVPVEAVEGEEKKEPEVIKEKKEVPAEGKEEEPKEKSK
ncbi:MAG: 50S ribosomal protein L25/general stress protein Ctc [Candidatus Omnitrophica bacterium]|nr:50S ribosomal protein L25/general stress protein Ctc [Candidatus Omnitrophota bacterium]